MEETLEFSDLKFEEEETDDAETLKLIATLEEVRFDSIFQASWAIGLYNDIGTGKKKNRENKTGEYLPDEECSKNRSLRTGSV